MKKYSTQLWKNLSDALLSLKKYIIESIKVCQFYNKEKINTYVCSKYMHEQNSVRKHFTVATWEE